MEKIKAQSAMEYLMAYGLAILIILVIIGAVYTLLNSQPIYNAKILNTANTVNTINKTNYIFNLSYNGSIYHYHVYLGNGSLAPTCLMRVYTLYPNLTNKALLGRHDADRLPLHIVCDNYGDN